MPVVSYSEFDKEIVQRYKNYYISYEQLLQAMSILRKRELGEDTGNSLLRGLVLPKEFTLGDTTALNTLMEQRPEVRFVSLLEHELSKVNHFSALEVKTMMSNLRQLERRLNQFEQLDGFAERVSGSKPPSSVFFSSIGDSAAGPKEGRLGVIKNKIMATGDEVAFLNHYARLNEMIFQKLVNSFDETFSDRPPISSWFLPRLPSEPFMTLPLNETWAVVSTLLEKCDKLMGNPAVSYTLPITLSDRSVNPLQLKVLSQSARPPLPAIKHTPVAQAMTTQAATATVIYPKNYMANERSCLAWISACSVQGAIGIALVGRSKSFSFLGTLACFSAVTFLWWAVYVFVKRYRQIKRPVEGRDFVFYSSSMPTAFGVAQILVLFLQCIVVWVV